MAYLTLARANDNGRWEIINANCPYEEVLAETKRIIQERLIANGFIERLSSSIETLD